VFPCLKPFLDKSRRFTTTAIQHTHFTLYCGLTSKRYGWGPQQSDTLGPLLFCLTVQLFLNSIQSLLIAGFMDDFDFGGPENVVDRDIAVVTSTSTSLCLYINLAKKAKYELVHLQGSSIKSAVLGSFKSITPDEAALLVARCCQAKSWTQRWVCAAPINRKLSLAWVTSRPMARWFCCGQVFVRRRFSTFCVVMSRSPSLNHFWWFLKIRSYGCNQLQIVKCFVAAGVLGGERWSSWNP